MESPHVRPILVTLRKILPRPIPAALSHSSKCSLTQSGIGTVRTCPALPSKSTIAQCSSRCCRSSILRPTASCRLSPTRRQQRKKCSISFPFETPAIWHLPKRVSLFYGQPVSKANTQFLHTFDAANACREIRTEQAAIGSFVDEPPHSAQAEVDSSWSQLPGFQMAPVP